MISVIIPVYNGENFIDNCYVSLNRQTIKDWEAIFIDDGSKDRTLEQLNKISEKDNRVRVLHKENEGVAIAREWGIKEAHGEFCTFLDVDDTLVDNALEQYIRNFYSEDISVVIPGINMVSNNGKLYRKISYKEMIISGSRAIEYVCKGIIRWQLCGKAFRTSLFCEVITPKSLRSAEDMAVCLQAIVKANNVIVLNECLYNYVQVSTSVTHSKAKEISYDALKAAEFVKKTIGDKIDRTSLNCLFLLIISGALRAGISSKDKLFRNSVMTHGNLKSIIQLSTLKAINVGIFKFLHLNLARYL